MAHHHYRSPWRRGFYSLALIVFILMIGTVGLHSLDNMPLVDAFYFTSMIATAQGPTSVLHTNAAKLFASFMAFVSVGFAVASLGFLFGPFFGKLWRMGAMKLEDELHTHAAHRRDKEPPKS